MIQIDNIEINYFRSIYNIQLKCFPELVVFAGQNDVGKSNILKALNLFFNNQTDWNTSFNFIRDFSNKRLMEARKVKGRQFIRISIRFIRGDRYEKSLPDRFTVTKTWYRDSRGPDEKNSLAREFKKEKTAKWKLNQSNRSLQRYLNTIKFEYIPAIKDQHFFNYMLGSLQDVIFGKRESESALKKSVLQLNSTVEEEAKTLGEEFNVATGIQTQIRTPEEIGELFRSFSVNTKLGTNDIPLNLRGDGIRSRYIPSLLNYISRNSKLYYVWGFEEPENSLEHKLATKLAEEIKKVYCLNAQVFITSHSPAFFTIEEDDYVAYRVFMKEDMTRCNIVNQNGGGQDNIFYGMLEDELGLMDFQRKNQLEYKKKVQELEKTKLRIRKIHQNILAEKLPILLTEGKFDVRILKAAQDKLGRGGAKNKKFRIISSDPYPETTKEDSGGASTVRKCLESTRHDEPITVGLFDRDFEGYKEFDKLSNNFIESDYSQDVKIQKTGTSAAILLPIHELEKDYAAIFNLVLEYYFEDKYLEKKINGKGLKFEARELITKLSNSGLEISRTLAKEKCYRTIVKDSKKVFAEGIVPTFPSEAFSSFNLVFGLMDSTVLKLTEIRRENIKN